MVTVLSKAPACIPPAGVATMSATAVVFAKTSIIAPPRTAHVMVGADKPVFYAVVFRANYLTRQQPDK
jgi:hypothetical protein